VLGVVVIKKSDTVLQGLPLVVPPLPVVVGRFVMGLTQPNQVMEIVRINEELSYINVLRDFSVLEGFNIADS